MSVLDDTIARLQYHADACTTMTIKSAPDFPVDSLSQLPMSIAYIGNGEVDQRTKYDTKFLFTINVDTHFDRKLINKTYKNIDAYIQEYLRRLGGDPTLNGTVNAIVFPVIFSVSPAEWDSVVTQMLRFSVQVKYLTTPL